MLHFVEFVGNSRHHPMYLYNMLCDWANENNRPKQYYVGDAG